MIAHHGTGSRRKTTSDTRYFISSLPCDVIEFSRAVRSHWSIENSLHWRLDVVFREDDSRQRMGHSARAFSQIRRITLSLLNQEQTDPKSRRAKRKKGRSQSRRHSQSAHRCLTFMRLPWFCVA